METNEWEKLEDVVRGAYVIIDSKGNGFEDIKDYISQHFIPISELKRWVEEREEKFGDRNVMDLIGDPMSITPFEQRAIGRMQFRKLLSDKFIKE